MVFNDIRHAVISMQNAPDVPKLIQQYARQIPS